jgi:hypothetical protein
MKSYEQMKPHEQRVAVELKQLTELREKLGLFQGTAMFNGLPTDEQARLRRQFDIMIQYEGILQERIDHFPA